MGQRQGLLLKASPTAVPKQVKITNISDKSLTVSWITDTNVVGYVKYGKSSGEIKGRKGDVRDQKSGSTGSYTTHLVELDGLEPNSIYYLKIGSGSEDYDNNGNPFEAKTAPVTTTVPTADTINGKVITSNGGPVPAALVYVTMEGVTEMAALTSNLGNWTLTLSNARRADLADYATYDKATTRLTIFVQAGSLGTATAVTTTKNDSPVANITLGESHDFSADTGLGGSEEATGAAQMAGASEVTPTVTAGPQNMANTIVIKDNQLSVAALTVDPGTAVMVINQDKVAHSLTAVKKEFDSGIIAAGASGTVVMPLTPGEYEFNDSTMPTAEGLKGKITVQSSQTAEATPTPTATTTPADTEALVKLLNPGKDGVDIATASPEIKVQGPRGTRVKITVNSEETQTTTLTLDEDGLIAWTPPNDLEPGEHTVTIEYEDEAGVMQKIVRTFTVQAAEADNDDITGFSDSDEPATGVGGSTPGYQASPTPTKTPTPTATVTVSPRAAMPSTESGIPEAGTMSTTIALLGLGLLLFIGGLAWQVRPRPISY